MKSLPNIIKSNRVYISDNDYQIIDSNSPDAFAPIRFPQVTQMQLQEEEPQDGWNYDHDSFQVNHVNNASSQLEEITSYADTLLEDAKREAEEIRQQAIESAKQEISVLKEEARSEGYARGVKQAEGELETQRLLLLQKEADLNLEYQNKLDGMQSTMTELLIALLHKLTGVVLEEKSIITYLVADALKGQSTCNEFRIRVSKRDYPTLMEDLPIIQGLVKSTAQVIVVEDPEICDNECKIDTDRNIIDCSMETKLNNLKMALKLLGE